MDQTRDMVCLLSLRRDAFGHVGGSSTVRRCPREKEKWDQTKECDMDDGLCSGVFFPGTMRDISNLQLLKLA